MRSLRNKYMREEQFLEIIKQEIKAYKEHINSLPNWSDHNNGYPKGFEEGYLAALYGMQKTIKKAIKKQSK